MSDEEDNAEWLKPTLIKNELRKEEMKQKEDTKPKSSMFWGDVEEFDEIEEIQETTEIKNTVSQAAKIEKE